MEVRGNGEFLLTGHRVAGLFFFFFFFFFLKKFFFLILGTSLAVQWLRLQASTEGGVGSIPGQGTKISSAAQQSPKKFF